MAVFVKDILSRNVISVHRATTLKQLVQMFSKFHTFPLVPVVDEQTHLVGTVLFENILDIFKPYRHEILKSIPLIDRQEADILSFDIDPTMGELLVVDDLMAKKFIAVKITDTLEHVYEIMRVNNKDVFPVVDDHNQLVGIIGLFDIVMSMFKEKGIV
ncbi:MAG: CBS domain-containing protein [Candidatus Omnitrophota bacterium]